MSTLSSDEGEDVHHSNVAQERKWAVERQSLSGFRSNNRNIKNTSATKKLGTTSLDNKTNNKNTADTLSSSKNTSKNKNTVTDDESTSDKNDSDQEISSSASKHKQPTTKLTNTEEEEDNQSKKKKNSSSSTNTKVTKPTVTVTDNDKAGKKKKPSSDSDDDEESRKYDDDDDESFLSSPQPSLSQPMVPNSEGFDHRQNNSNTIDGTNTVGTLQRQPSAEWHGVTKKSNKALLAAATRAWNTNLLEQLNVGDNEDNDDDANDEDNDINDTNQEDNDDTLDIPNSNVGGTNPSIVSKVRNTNESTTENNNNTLASLSSLPTALLSSPDLSAELTRLRAFEERLKRKEIELLTREAAVEQVDARQKMAHQLRKKLDEQEKNLKKKELLLDKRERTIDEQVKKASEVDRNRLASLLIETETLVTRLKSDVEEKEAELRKLQEEYEPRMLMLAAKEASITETYRIQMETLTAKETEMAAMMVAVRDSAAVFRLPQVVNQANEAIVSLSSSSVQPTNSTAISSDVLAPPTNNETTNIKENIIPSSPASSSSVVDKPVSPATPVSLSSSSPTAKPNTQDMLHWLNERFTQQQKAVAEAKSKGLTSTLPMNVIMQAQAQAQQYNSLLSSIGSSTTPKITLTSPSAYFGASSSYSTRNFGNNSSYTTSSYSIVPNLSNPSYLSSSSSRRSSTSIPLFSSPTLASPNVPRRTAPTVPFTSPTDNNTIGSNTES